MRHAPRTIQICGQCLRGYPPYMKVEAKRRLGGRKDLGRPSLALHVAARLGLNFPNLGDRHPKSVIEVERAC